MIDISKQRWIIVAASHCALYFVVSQINHYMTPLTLNATIFGLFAGFSGLCLGYVHGLFSIIPVTFVFDSRSPLEFGSVFVLTFVVFSLVYFLRHQFRKESRSAGAIVSLASNALIFIGITLVTLATLNSSSSNLSYILANLIWSSLVVLILSKYYFDFLYSLLGFFGVHLAEEQRNER